MLLQPRQTLPVIEQRICDLVATHFCLDRNALSPSNSFIEDFAADSLDMIEFVMEIEREYGVSLDNDSRHPIGKSIFARQPFRIADLAEAVFNRLGGVAPHRSFPVRGPVAASKIESIAFTQLGGRWIGRLAEYEPLFERISEVQYQRRSDGMRCIRIPPDTVEIGGDDADVPADEGPRHTVELDAFLIDAEPVSTAAYSRFLNSVGPVSDATLVDWFVLGASDDRRDHASIHRTDRGWEPVSGTETLPMILVSWYGANAYSLWANGREWRNYRDDGGDPLGSFLPSEAQWEYAARGSSYRKFPWGDAPASDELLQYGRHSRSQQYRVDTLPLAPVHVPLGLSPFGLHHMAGNVWQWCRDWYDADFYGRDESRIENPVNRLPSRVRSERGGSWIGPAELCRSSYRRGRPPLARGRCLGFRCISSIESVTSK